MGRDDNGGFADSNLELLRTQVLLWRIFVANLYLICISTDQMYVF